VVQNYYIEKILYVYKLDKNSLSNIYEEDLLAFVIFRKHMVIHA